MPQVIGVPRETAAGEKRVATVPEVVERLIKLGFKVAVESGAGDAANFSDDVYRAAGAEIVEDAARLWSGSEIVFKVRGEASKDKIREAVEQLFKVTVLRVRTMNFMGKERRKGAFKGRQMDWKKAYVTLKEGDKIEFFEGL
jgi:NAD/NADP transhydrogenase alpha subunit